MKTFKLILINLFVLAILMVIIDPFLAIEKKDDVKISRSLGLREYGPNRAITLNPEGHGVDTKNLDSKSYIIETNETGFIVGPNQGKDDKCEVLFFGGSTTECAFVDDSLRFPFLVGEQINRVTGNAGYGGNHSFHSLINLLGKGIDEKPEMVIWMHNINDFSLLSKTGSYFISPRNRDVLLISKPAAEASYKGRIKNLGNAFFQAAIPNIYLRAYMLTKPQSGQVDEWAGYRELDVVEDSIIQQTFKSSLKSFIAIAKEHRIQVVLMTQFNRINEENSEIMKALGGGSHYSDEHFIALYKSLNSIIRQVAVEENVPLIDLAKRIPATSDYLYDAVHLNNAGSKLVANIIASDLSLIQREVEPALIVEPEETNAAE